MSTYAERLHLHAHDLDDDGHDTLGGGSALTVRDVDGTPTVSSVDTIMFTNGTVTDNGGGSVTVTVTGGGGSLSVDDGGTPVTGVTSITFDGADVGDNGGGSINVTILADHYHDWFDFTGDGTEDEFELSGLDGGLITHLDVFVNGVRLQEDIGGGGDWTRASTDPEVVTFTPAPTNLAVIYVNVTRNP